MKKFIQYLFLTLFLAGCGGKKSKQDPEPNLPPAVAKLIFPEQNALCTSGIVNTDAQSTITFRWGAADNAESYQVTIKNLQTGTEVTQTSNQTQLAVALTRNTPFSWYVTSKSQKSASEAKSDTWKFYNSGSGITNYAPYPADNLQPALNQVINAGQGKTTLTWTGNDIDNDIVDYDIYLGTTATPPLYKAHVTSDNLSEVAVAPATQYFWKVITRDGMGNTSTSDVIQFTTK
jgi:hypothetical protein